MSEALQTALSAQRPLPVEMLCSDFQRRPCGLDRLQYETERTASPADEIDELVAELRSINPEEMP